jgi:hypothetical protein
VFADNPESFDLASLIEALKRAGATTKCRMTAGEIAKAAASNQSLNIALGDHTTPHKVTTYLRRYLDTPCGDWSIRREKRDEQWVYWVGAHGRLDL